MGGTRVPGSLTGRMVVSTTMLAALLLCGGFLMAVHLDLPLWSPLLLASILVLLQALVAPTLIEVLVPADVVVYDDSTGRYGCSGPLGEIVAARCREMGLPLVKLGIVADGMPSAFRVATRIDLLARSGLPGAPTNWQVTAEEAVASTAREQKDRLRRALPVQILAWLLPPALFVSYLTWSQGWVDFGFLPRWWLVPLGLALLARSTLRYRARHHEPVERVTDLLHRLDTSPSIGVPVELRGRVIGRGSPGYVLSPDLVIADDSGRVPIIYTNPFPFMRSRFGLMRSEDFQDRDVVARGWCFRSACGPCVELRDVRVVEGDEPTDSGHGTEFWGSHYERPTSARGWGWLASRAIALVVLSAGVLIAAYG